MAIAQNCAVVIPCLNEARTIHRLVAEVREYVRQVFVVDDGSSDCTAEAARNAGAEVIGREQSGGKGLALRAGFRHAIGCGFPWALALDGDGQHSAADIPKFFHRAAERNVHMIVGNRMESPQSMPFVRRLVNRWMSARLSQFCGMKLPDSQCGFRLIHLDSWRRFDFSAEHFEAESEFLIRFVAAGLNVEFVPIETRYGGEQSKIHPVRDTVRWFRWWRAIRQELSHNAEGGILFSESPDVSRAALR